MYYPVARKKISCRNTRAHGCNSSFPFVPTRLATGVALRRDKTVRQFNERMIYETLQWVVERTCILSSLLTSVMGHGDEWIPLSKGSWPGYHNEDAVVQKIRFLKRVGFTNRLFHLLCS